MAVVGHLLALISGLPSGVHAQSPYETISWLQQDGSANVSYTTTGLITQVLSKPGVVNGITYNYYAFYVQDATGGADIFGYLPSGGTYTSPTAGDVVSVTGIYAPFHEIPEIGGTAQGDITAITKIGTAAVPAATPETISYIAQERQHP